MKKLIWIFILIGIVGIIHAQTYQGSIATTDYTIGLTILLEDNATPVPDGLLCQIMLPGIDDFIDAPNPDGSPGGDDFLVTGIIPGNNFYEFGWDSSWTGIIGQHYGTTQFLWPAAGSGTEPCANAGENFYLRLFDAPTISGATKYLNTALYLLPAGHGDLYFNTTAHWDYGTEFNWQDIDGSGPTLIDWGGGMTGTVDVGTPSLPGRGYGNGLPNEDLLASPENIDLFFTLAIVDGAPVEVTICLDLASLGYSPLNLAYWVNDSWIYEPISGQIPWLEECVTFILDPTVTDRSGKTKDDKSKGRINKGGNTRELVDIPIVFSNEDGALPVTLSTFTAEFSYNYPTLYWETASESDNMGWNIYRAISSNLGQSAILNLNTIPGNGTTSEPTYYSFVDEYEVQENFTYWYWLESISISGETGIFGPVALTIPLDNNDIQEIPMATELYQNFPNPFNPDTSISFDVKEGETGFLSIYNIKGQLIFSDEFETGSHIYTWDASDQASGIYLYKLHTESYSKMIKMLLVK